jgi:hypothetical protein
MVEEHSDSIFDFASKKTSRPPSKKKREEPPPPPPPPSSDTHPLEVEDLEQRLAVIFEKQAALNQKLAETYRRSGQTRDTVIEYLANPQNFTETTWKVVQRQRQEFVEKIAVLGKKSGGQELRKKQKVLEEKKRKGKTLGARRHWLSLLMKALDLCPYESVSCRD